MNWEYGVKLVYLDINLAGYRYEHLFLISLIYIMRNKVLIMGCISKFKLLVDTLQLPFN